MPFPVFSQGLFSFRTTVQLGEKDFLLGVFLAHSLALQEREAALRTELCPTDSLEQVNVLS